MLQHLTSVIVAWGPVGILLLSILDSGGIPVAGVFDVLLVIVAADRPGVGWLCAGMAVTGSTIGNFVLFWTARRGGKRFMPKPGAAGRHAKFRAWFHRYGLISVFVPALVPVPMPLKIFVISAGALGTPRIRFIGTVFIARSIRYFGEAWLGMALGRKSANFLTSHVWEFAAAAGVLFVVLYLYIVIRNRGRGIQPV